MRRTAHQIAEVILAELDFYDGATTDQVLAMEAFVKKQIAEAITAEREWCAQRAKRFLDTWIDEGTLAPNGDALAADIRRGR